MRSRGYAQFTMQLPAAEGEDATSPEETGLLAAVTETPHHFRPLPKLSHLPGKVARGEYILARPCLIQSLTILEKLENGAVKTKGAGREPKTHEPRHALSEIGDADLVSSTLIGEPQRALYQNIAVADEASHARELKTPDNTAPEQLLPQGPQPEDPLGATNQPTVSWVP
ncbi:hypothetical protein BDP67DRAFT_490600 [Colletotrichum lupini]|nr:hypothetical protein BDP67DRAFT_490600 [Colletotrichum lupini]